MNIKAIAYAVGVSVAGYLVVEMLIKPNMPKG
jgi:hypothetical protein